MQYYGSNNVEGIAKNWEEELSEGGWSWMEVGGAKHRWMALRGGWCTVYQCPLFLMIFYYNDILNALTKY